MDLDEFYDWEVVTGVSHKDGVLEVETLLFPKESNEGLAMSYCWEGLGSLQDQGAALPLRVMASDGQSLARSTTGEICEPGSYVDYAR